MGPRASLNIWRRQKSLAHSDIQIQYYPACSIVSDYNAVTFMFTLHVFLLWITSVDRRRVGSSQHFFIWRGTINCIIDLSDMPFPLRSLSDLVLPCMYQWKTSKIQAAFFLLLCLQRHFFPPAVVRKLTDEQNRLIILCYLLLAIMWSAADLNFCKLYCC